MKRVTIVPYWALRLSIPEVPDHRRPFPLLSRAFAEKIKQLVASQSSKGGKEGDGHGCHY